MNSIVETNAANNNSKWAITWQNQQNEYAPSEDLDQPGHLSSLIRVQLNYVNVNSKSKGLEVVFPSTSSSNNKEVDIKIYNHQKRLLSFFPITQTHVLCALKKRLAETFLYTHKTCDFCRQLLRYFSKTGSIVSEIEFELASISINRSSNFWWFSVFALRSAGN